MTWRNTTARCHNQIQTQQNYLINIISNAMLIKTKLSPLYEQLHLLKLNIYYLEVLKFACKFKIITCLDVLKIIFNCLFKSTCT